MGESTISTIAAELVQAGWPRQEPDANGLYNALASSWWCAATEPGLIDDDGPRQLLTLHHCSGWCCTVAAEEDGQVVDLSIWIELPNWDCPCCMATAGWWPGLRALVAMANSLLTAMPADTRA